MDRTFSKKLHNRLRNALRRKTYVRAYNMIQVLRNSCVPVLVSPYDSYECHIVLYATFNDVYTLYCRFRDDKDENGFVDAAITVNSKEISGYTIYKNEVELICALDTIKKEVREYDN